MVVEFGASSSTKTPLLLSAIAPRAYVPIDVSGEFLHESLQALSLSFPRLAIYPVVADFTKPLRLPRLDHAQWLGFFPGSTIGNFVAPEAVDLLRTMASALGEDAQLLIGVDRIKSEQIFLPVFIIGFSIPLSALMVWLLRRACPLRPVLTAVLLGLASAAASACLLQIFHEYDTAATDLLTHALAVVVVIVLNAALSGRLLSKAWDK